MKFNAKKLTLIIIGIVSYLVLFYFLLRKADFQNVFSIMKSVGIKTLFLCIIASILMITFQGLFLKKTFDLYKGLISWKEAIIVWLLTVPTGALTVGLSGPAIIFYYARKKNIPLLYSSAAVFFYHSTYFLVCMALITFGGGISIYRSNLNDSDKILLYFLIILIVLALIILANKKIRIRILSYLHRIFPNLVTTPSKQEYLIPPAKSILSLALVALLALGSNYTILYFTFHQFGIDVSLLQNLKFFVIAQTVSIFSPSGGGFGFVELGLAGSLTLFNINAATAAALVVFYRFFEFWVPALLGLYFLAHKGYRKINNLEH